MTLRTLMLTAGCVLLLAGCSYRTDDYGQTRTTVQGPFKCGLSGQCSNGGYYDAQGWYHDHH